MQPAAAMATCNLCEKTVVWVKGVRINPEDRDYCECEETKELVK